MNFVTITSHVLLLVYPSGRVRAGRQGLSVSRRLTNENSNFSIYQHSVYNTAPVPIVHMLPNKGYRRLGVIGVQSRQVQVVDEIDHFR